MKTEKPKYNIFIKEDIFFQFEKTHNLSELTKELKQNIHDEAIWISESHIRDEIEFAIKNLENINNITSLNNVFFALFNIGFKRNVSFVGLKVIPIT